MSEIVHTLPTFGRAHVESGFACWCEPEYLTPYDECDAEPGCWKCGGGGTLRVDNPNEHDGPHGIIVVHNAHD